MPKASPTRSPSEPDPIRSIVVSLLLLLLLLLLTSSVFFPFISFFFTALALPLDSFHSLHAPGHARFSVFFYPTTELTTNSELQMNRSEGVISSSGEVQSVASFNADTFFRSQK